MLDNYRDEDKVLVAVDCIIFGFDPQEGELKLLLTKRNFEPEKGKWSLIGGFLHANESIEDAAQRVLKKLTGIRNIYLQQLQVYSKIDRDPAKRTISVSFNALLNIQNLKRPLNQRYSATWFPISHVPSLIFDHKEMLDYAITSLRFKASYYPISFELLPEKFTIRQLQSLYEEIFSTKFDSGNFAKKVLSIGLLEKLDEKDMRSSKKGSFLYRFNEQEFQRQGSASFYISFQNSTISY